MLKQFSSNKLIKIDVVWQPLIYLQIYKYDHNIHRYNKIIEIINYLYWKVEKNSNYNKHSLNTEWNFLPGTHSYTRNFISIFSNWI